MLCVDIHEAESDTEAMGRKKLLEPASAADGIRIPPPKGLRGARLLVEGEEFAVLVFPIETKSAPTPVLTEAERAVSLLTLKGFANEEIAALRGASHRTVANQLQSIYRKLGVGSRVELAHKLASIDPDLTEPPAGAKK
jgi:DNA-binding CsgD family transcriptional regulator